MRVGAEFTYPVPFGYVGFGRVGPSLASVTVPVNIDVHRKINEGPNRKENQPSVAQRHNTLQARGFLLGLGARWFYPSSAFCMTKRAGCLNDLKVTGKWWKWFRHPLSTCR